MSGPLKLQAVLRCLTWVLGTESGFGKSKGFEPLSYLFSPPGPISFQNSSHRNFHYWLYL